MSKCNVPSKRLDYIRELKQADIDVDVYGKCGKPCPAKSSVPEDCYKELSKNYKFFLSFENSYCKDYTTEKVFGALKQPWIPVVRGGDNYSLILPERSVVDASYHSPEQLARILRQIASNETLYTEVILSGKKHIRLNFTIIAPPVLPLPQFGFVMHAKNWEISQLGRRIMIFMIGGLWRVIAQQINSLKQRIRKIVNCIIEEHQFSSQYFRLIHFGNCNVVSNMIATHKVVNCIIKKKTCW